MFVRGKKESVKIRKIGKDLFLNPFTIADEEWMLGRWSEEEINKGFIEGNVPMFLAFFWQFLDDDSKRLVRDCKIMIWDNMVEKQMDFSDPAEKLKHIVSGENEVRAIIDAIVKTRLSSLPDQVENEKKKMMADLPSQIPNYLTSSQGSTVGNERILES